jgi:hypothetical protein
MSGHVFQVASKETQVLISLTIFLIAAAFLAPPAAEAAKPPKDPPTDPGPTCGSIEQLYQWATLPGKGWQFGNLNHNNSQYIEGESVPYYTHITDLTVGAQYLVNIEFDSTKGGYHALDYLTTYDRDYTPNPLPCAAAGVDCSSPTPFPIPLDDAVTNEITQDPGDFTIWGGIIDYTQGPDVSQEYYYSGDPAGDSSTSIDVIFTATSSEVVISWGGHIASAVDWGIGNSAGMISGSPYHMRLEAFEVLIVEDPEEWDTCNVGNRDRSLSAAAVIIPAELTIIKDTQPDFLKAFDFTLTDPNQLQQQFSLTDVGGLEQNQQSFGGLTEFGIYMVEESVPPGWLLDSIVCNDGSSQVPPTAMIDVDEGDRITCTFVNRGNAPAIDLAKSGTWNDDGDGYAEVGETISYSFTVTNTGNVTLRRSDPVSGAGSSGHYHL